jgi:predicted RNase H-like HicB family nuclease
MERMIQLQIEHLPEGVYLATSDDIQGLIAQGNTLQSTIEIARDIAKKLIESQSDSYSFGLPLMSGCSFNYPMVVGV